MQNYILKLKILTLYIVVLIFTFSFFNFSNAAGLVPCGGKTETGEAEPACSWCNLIQMFKNVIDFMFYIIFPLAAAMIIYGGFLIMTAAGSPAKISKGREIITAAIIGLLIALFSYFIVDIIIKMVAGEQNWINAVGPWNELKCTAI